MGPYSQLYPNITITHYISSTQSTPIRVCTTPELYFEKPKKKFYDFFKKMAFFTNKNTVVEWFLNRLKLRLII